MSSSSVHSHRPLWLIMEEIAADPCFTDAVARTAGSAVEAVSWLVSIRDRYINDTGAYCVGVLVGRLDHWRGPTARRIKDELRTILSDNQQLNARQRRAQMRLNGEHGPTDPRRSGPCPPLPRRVPRHCEVI